MRSLRKTEKIPQKEQGHPERTVLPEEISKSVSPEMRQQITDVMRRYQGKSQEEMMQDIVVAVQEGKQKGEIDNAMLQRCQSMLRPMLNDSQRGKLDTIMNQLKS